MFGAWGEHTIHTIMIYVYSSSMRLIPLNLQTLYEDVAQRVRLSDVPPASLSRKKIDGKVHIYAVIKAGAQRRQAYIGPEGDPKTTHEAARYRRARREGRETRAAIQALHRSGVRGPGIDFGRLLEALADARLFERGVVLVGTVAYQLYPPVVGAFLGDGPSRTQDADLALARIALPHLVEAEDLQKILRRADPTFEAKWHAQDELPRAFSSERGIVIEMLTTRGRADGPVQIKGLGCAAQPLPYLEYLIEEPIETVALYGTGVRVSVPDPARYAVHKLIVHALRKGPKAQKDLVQARELIEVLRARDPGALEMAIEDAVRRGKAWRTFVRQGLAKINA